MITIALNMPGIRKSLALIVPAAGVIAVLMILFYSLLGTKLVIRNCSAFLFENVQAVLASDTRDTIWQGELNPRERIRVMFFPEGDSSFQISGKWNGKDLSEQGGYTTGLDNSTHVFTLMPSGEFEYDIDSGARC